MSDEKYTILHLASSERWTGVADPVVSLCEHQQTLGHKVWLGCVRGRSFEKRAKQRGVRLMKRIHLDRRLNPFHVISDLIAIRRFVKEHKIDIVHTHLVNDNWLAALSLVGLNNRPLLVRTMHKSTKPASDVFHRFLFTKLTNLIIAVSETDRKTISETLDLDLDRVKCVYGGVDTEMFHPDNKGDEFRAEIGVPGNAPLIGIVARIRKDRGFDTFVRAIPIVLEQNANVYFTIIGRGEYKKTLQKKIKTLPERTQQQIKMAGYRKYNLAEAIAGLTALAFLKPGSEGSCRAILEAMASGKPVIAERLGVIPETVADKKAGYIIALDDHNELAQAILKCANNPNQTERMGQAAREIILTKFTPEKRAHDTLAAYRGALRRDKQSKIKNAKFR